MIINQRERTQQILEQLSEQLDIPDYIYEDATLKYEDVGMHLGNEESRLLFHSPQVYPQGSFRLGTVVRPISVQDDYDIDLACCLDIAKESTTHHDLKHMIGDRLKERSDLEAMLSESRRCWRLDYPGRDGAPGFHMDVLSLNTMFPPSSMSVVRIVGTPPEETYSFFPKRGP